MLKTTMKAFLSTAVLAAGCMIGSSAMAQAPAAKVTGKHPMKHLAKQLNLTKAEKQQIQTIRKNDQERLKADRAALKAAPKGSAQKNEARVKLRDDRQAMMQQIRGTLTPEQQAKFDQIVANRKAKAEQRIAARKAAKEARSSQAPAVRQ